MSDTDKAGSRFSRRAAMAIMASSAMVAMAKTSPAAANAIYPIAADTFDPLMQGLSIPADAHVRGMWSPQISWPIVSIHAAVLPDGRVLTFGSPTGRGVQDGRTLVYWNPRTGFRNDNLIITGTPARVDTFCASAVLMSDGRLLVTGGTGASGFSSREGLFADYRNSTSQRMPDLNAPRWYGTVTRLPDGRMVITGGGVPYAPVGPNLPPSLPSVSSTPEIYSEGGVWESLFGAFSTDAFGALNSRWWYPRQWVSPAGTLFGVSVEKVWEMRWREGGSIRTLRDFKQRPTPNATPNTGVTNTAVMYDTGLILQVGGNGYSNGDGYRSSREATIFDITRSAGDRVDLSIRETNPMIHPRQWADAIALPTGDVFVVGGSRFADRAGGDAVYETEIWSPRTQQWTQTANVASYRGYHSVAVLLQNGTVFASGGGVPGPVDNFSSQIYYPPYLFESRNGGSVLRDRPRIVSATSNSVRHGVRLRLQVEGGAAITGVSMTALGSVTHSFDSNQRRVSCSFRAIPGGVEVDVPASPNIAPPGYYHLNVVDERGTPSAGFMVAVDAVAPGHVSGRTANRSAYVSPGQLFGIGTRNVSYALDGSVGRIDNYRDIWLHPRGGAAVRMPGKAVDIAVIDERRFYVIGTDGNIYRWNGSRFNLMGVNSVDIAVNHWGRIVTCGTGKDLWTKSQYDDVNNWQRIPHVSNAIRVGVIWGQSIYYIGEDFGVYRSDGRNPPVRVGAFGTEISASGDGTVGVIGGGKQVWFKRDDSNRNEWYPTAAIGETLAVRNRASLMTTDDVYDVYQIR